MGFDLTGRKPINMINIDKPYIDWSKNPSSEEKEQYSRDMEAYEKAVPGDYFRNNVWWWRPLWTYVCEVCDDILTEDEMGSGSYNDGTIIYKYKAIQIAKRLQTLIDDGKVKEYAEKYTNKLKALPLKECDLVIGDGIR
ncbi:hypothetical protein CMI37_29080, partial [Candidatus Pacearchaeota archaeon]|nr:hypothetical protein [Candidatus Pacearchaeota archaeon]